MKNESDTPLTDAAQKAYEDYCQRIVDAWRDGKVSLDMAMDDFTKTVGPCPNNDWETARTLERRCKRLEEALRKLKDQAEWHGPNPHVDQVERAHFKNALEQARIALAEQKEEKV